jgi:hypothetical protein
MKNKRLSAFSKEFWIQRGYSEKQAEYKRNSIRPIKKEYWIEKGYSEFEAQIKANETKQNNNKKGAKSARERSKEDIYKSSIRRKEYWIERGFTAEEAIEQIKKVQANNSLENYIKRHGLEEGYDKWKTRQLKWQETLNIKTDKEKQNINKRKNSIKLDFYDNVEEAISTLNKIRNMNLVSDYASFEEQICDLHKDRPYIFYMPYDIFLEKYVPKIQLEIFDRLGIEYSKISCLFKQSQLYFNKKGNKQSYRKWVGKDLLRSSYEIYFYETFITKHPNEKIEIDNKYPNSNMRYDFFIGGKYIEICPMIDKDEKYKQKMNKKKELFNCVLLSSLQEIDNFIESF